MKRIKDHSKQQVFYLDVKPMPKPTMTIGDRRRTGGRVRPVIAAYRLFKEKCALEWSATGEKFPDAGAMLTFLVPMYKSWSKQKQMAMLGRPHDQSKSHDIDNLVKACFDAIMPGEDSRVYDVRANKYWWYEGEGGILVRMPDYVYCPTVWGLYDMEELYGKEREHE